MSLLEKIKKTMGELPEKPVFSFVGAGGKTTCVLKLADELAGLGMKVLVTTSTHIQHPFYLGRTGLLDADTKTIKEAGVPGNCRAKTGAGKENCRTFGNTVRRSVRKL